MTQMWCASSRFLLINIHVEGEREINRGAHETVRHVTIEINYNASSPSRYKEHTADGVRTGWVAGGTSVYAYVELAEKRCAR